MDREELPLGIQTFENIIQGQYVYVDKTDLVYKVVITWVKNMIQFIQKAKQTMSLK